MTALLPEPDLLSLRRVRRYLHAHPECSGEEFKTTAYLAEQLDGLGAHYRMGPDGRGLIVDSGKPHPGRPVVALRADMDALRMEDVKAVPYRSQAQNRMHACGHDAHCAMALGAVKLLMAAEFPPEVNWRCIFQPSEETAKGAREMIACDAMQDVRAIVAQHVDPALHVGQVGWRVGALTACCEEFEIIVEGKGGHAARPHTTVDPVATATLLVQMVYAQLPRSLNAQDPVVVSFSMIQGGVNPNVIPGRVEMRGTLRSLDPDAARAAKTRIREIADGLGQATLCRIYFKVIYSLPAVVNDPCITEICHVVAESVVGAANCVAIAQPSMGGEDFAWYLSHAPGCMLRLGVGTPMQPVRHLHASDFDIDERALPIGARLLAQSVLSIAQQIK